jgi:hypothetical protein
MAAPTIFHEHWWLDAAAGSDWSEISSSMSSGQRASMFVYKTRKVGLPMLGMPPLTRTLGPHITGLEGKNETARRMKLYLLDQIIRQLPRHMIFNQVFEPWETDALAFRLNNFSVNVEYTYRIEDCSDLDRIWSEMRDTMRRAIRKAEQRVVVESNQIDGAKFTQFYFSNLRNQGRSPNHTPGLYQRVLDAGLRNDAAEILTARASDGTIWAGIFTIWDGRTMYYLLTTQNKSANDSGSVAMLIWQAIKNASAKGLAFDFDGFGDRGTALFLSQFGGILYPRMRVSRMPKPLQGVLHLGPRFAPEN